MTKADLTEKIKDQTGMSSRESAEALEAVLIIIKDTLESGEKIKIAGFGNFTVKQKSDRKGRNPHTGEAITISARRILSFKPSPVLRDAINSNA